MPKSKRMKNNASSVPNEKEMMKLLLKDCSETNEDSKELISKHTGLRKTYLKTSKAPSNDSQQDENKKNLDLNRMSAYPPHDPAKDISHKFTMNEDIMKMMMRSNFPPRYPAKLENEDLEAYVMLEESGDNLQPVPTSDTKLTKTFIKFWNRMITKQDCTVGSRESHQLTEKEAGYFPCQLSSLCDLPENYLKKSFCHKSRYKGQGSQLLPSSNQFSKIAKRSQLKLEINQIFSHYSKPSNQYFLIPIELTSKLSRCMMKSLEISKLTQACNKITFFCDSQNFKDQNTHPLFTIEYKDTIEDELMPCQTLSLVNNYKRVDSSEAPYVASNLYKALLNYPYLSHFLERKDINLDGFFVRYWHYCRFFCSKLDLGNRVSNTLSIFMKDAILKYMLAVSVQICIAVKYWVLNPEDATYFRCWCGDKIYDEKQETRLVKRLNVGSAELFNHQRKIQEGDTFHNKHIERKSNIHICACNQVFKDHQSWTNHALSLKVSDITKICPIVIFNISNSSQDENKFVCECTDTFSDYDFWNFWIHICGCKIFRNLIKNQCHCSEKNREMKANRKRKRSPIQRGSEGKSRKMVNIIGKESIGSEEEDSCSAAMSQSKKGENNQLTNFDQSEEDEWQSGDNINLPLKVSNQMSSSEAQLGKSKIPK